MSGNDVTTIASTDSVVTTGHPFCSALTFYNMVSTLFSPRANTCPSPEIADTINHSMRINLCGKLEIFFADETTVYQKNPTPQNAFTLHQALTKAKTWLLIQLGENKNLNKYIEEKIQAIDRKQIELKTVMREDPETYVRFLLPKRFIKQDEEMPHRKSTLHLTPLNKQQKSVVMQTLIDLVRNDIASVPYILLALENNNFRIAIFDQEEFDQAIRSGIGDSNTEGFYDPNFKILALPNRPPYSATTISHELMHAGICLCNQKILAKNSHQQDKGRITVAIPPQKTLEDFDQALSRGKDKLTDFRTLILKKRQNKTQLTAAEEAFMQSAVDAISSCLPRTIRANLTPQDAAVIEKNMATNPSHITLTFPFLGSINTQVVSLSGTTAYVVPVDPVDAFLVTHMEIEETLALPAYRSNTHTVRGESEAHLTAHLSEDAMRAFFPELLALRTEFYAACFAEETNTRQMESPAVHRFSF